MNKVPLDELLSRLIEEFENKQTEVNLRPASNAYDDGRLKNIESIHLENFKYSVNEADPVLYQLDKFQETADEISKMIALI